MIVFKKSKEIVKEMKIRFKTGSLKTFEEMIKFVVD
jgi:hypothetical protein